MEIVRLGTILASLMNPIEINTGATVIGAAVRVRERFTQVSRVRVNAK